MTKQHQTWFEKLAEDRNESAKTLEKPSMSGFKRSVSDKYSEQAHFIYELLQNADDVKASECYFHLKDDGLYFKHNGRIKFSISDPDTELQDAKDGTLGHINSICSVGNSSKAYEENKQTIGKFGVGFKAVYQYTQTPSIYEDDFSFKITRFFVPEKLEAEIGNRAKNETLFYLPFDKTEMPKEQAYAEILAKLKTLTYPNLFLSHLKKIIWETQENNGIYSKNIIESGEKNDIIWRKIEVTQQNDSRISNEKLLLFTRQIEEQVHSYSVAFFIDKNDKLYAKQLPAFCFFPTQKDTKLNIAVHAPFFLTDSREGIKDENWNRYLVERLATLAADSLLVLRDLKLIDDDIISIIPYKEPEADDFFAPFYKAIKEKFETEELLPTNGGYAKKVNAYWAQDNPVLNLFSNEQLSFLAGNENARWVFRSLVRNQTEKAKELRSYIDDCIERWYDMNDMLRSINDTFIKDQTDEWLITLYEYLSKNNSYWNELKTKSLFLNEGLVPVPAFEKNGKLILFFPDADGNGYERLNEKLFSKGKKELYEKFGIREHTVADEIDEAITRFKNNKISTDTFFTKTFKYFKNECPQNEINNFIGKIKDFPFIPCYSNEKGFSSARNLFYPTEKLIEFYAPVPDTKFVDVQYLQSRYLKEEHTVLYDFLKKLGVKDKDPELKDRVYKIILPKYTSENNRAVATCCSDLKDILVYYQECPNNETENLLDKLKSLQFLLYKTNEKPKNRFIGKPNELYFSSASLQMYFQTKSDTKFIDLDVYHALITDVKEQQTLKTLLLRLGVSDSPKVIEQKSGSDFGTTKETKFILDGCESCIKEINTKDKSLALWGILKNIPFKELQKLEQCSKSTRPDRRHNFCTKNFISPDLEKIRKSKWLIAQNGTFEAPNKITTEQLDNEYEKESNQEKQLIELLQFLPSVELTKAERIAQKFDSEEEAEEARKALEEKRQNEKRKADRKISGTKAGIDADILEEAIESLENLSDSVSALKPKTEKEKTNALPDFDEDIELAKGIEDLKKQIEVKKSRVVLAEKINKSRKYSYDWFKTYLQLLKTYGEKQDPQKQKSVSFQQIKRYKADNKYFLLCGASSYISSEIENADDFKVALIFGNSKRENITVEGVSKKGQDLLIYCREPMSTHIISQFSNVFKVEINFTPVIDLLDRLYKAFTNSNYIDEWEDVQKVMPPLNFIYGPPGTGKTTTVCNKICDVLSENAQAKFLVLTPTNKAADVVCKKLKEISSKIYSVRLSRPTDPELEESGIYVDSLDNDSLRNIKVVTTTIHRLPYFQITGEKDGAIFEYKLFNYRNFDYVIFDEASMIGLHFITFAMMALFKTNTSTKFIVAGDPKQIPPIIEIDDKELENFDFQDENIYKMTKLESFNPQEQNIREIDTIKNLDMQFRSVPQIGQLFNELSYSNLLKHDRSTKRKECKQLPERLKNIISSNITFVDIPLNRDLSIYRINKLFYSSYHTYCAILVSEIIKFFDSVNDDKRWTIGLISPYKAQATLLNKLITSYGISDNLKIFSDTVHGFQGDECDIVFFVCNPNNYFYSGHKKALLSKEYIYNVAISRAKEYLIIFYPYTSIKDNRFINKICLSYRNNFGNARILDTKELEIILFKDRSFIENNCYFSGHDNINVFGYSDMKYFIKASDVAIDIQLRESKYTKQTAWRLKVE